MKTHWLTTPNVHWVSAGLLLVIGSTPFAAFAAERVVLGEQFTATWCPFSAYARHASSGLLDDYPDTFVLVQYHYADIFQEPWGNVRVGFYGVDRIPWAVFDGVDYRIGAMGESEAYARYVAAYNTRRAAPTDVDIQLCAEEVGPKNYRVWADVCDEREPPAEPRTVRVFVVQVLDYWPTDAFGAHHRNCFKQAATTVDLALNPGECGYVERYLTVDNDSWANQANITFVAWAQEPEDFGPAEVYQAAMIDWPFCVSDNQPPEIACNDPVVLWSPNHELVDVSSAFTVDDPDGDPVTLDIRVLSDETETPDTGDGTGRHAPDFKDELFEGGRGLLVRSERRGPEDGRFYLLVITADDGNGGVTTAVCVAAVCPHDQNDESLADVQNQADIALLRVEDVVDELLLVPPGDPLPEAINHLHEHPLSEELGPHQ